MGLAASAEDFGLPLAFFWRRARLWLIPLAVAFHLAILLSRNYAFLNLPQLLVFVAWEVLRSRRARTKAARLTPSAAGV